jgi:response regulator RpfG family c-di-GMP phosphodiesterase
MPTDHNQDVDLTGRNSGSVSEASTVLVVEDEPQVRDLTKRILEWHGYNVLTVESSPDALPLLWVRGEIGHILPLLKKPFDAEELLRSVSEAINSVPKL